MRDWRMLTQTKVFVIDDDAETARYIVHALQEAGHEADSQGNGRDGLKAALSEQGDPLIVDRMLPHVDGIELVESPRRGGFRTDADNFGRSR
jgi:two-component system OmpR family response regulator